MDVSCGDLVVFGPFRLRLIIHFYRVLWAASHLRVLFSCVVSRSCSLAVCWALIYTSDQEYIKYFIYSWSDRWLILRRNMQILMLAMPHLFLRSRFELWVAKFLAKFAICLLTNMNMLTVKCWLSFASPEPV